MENADSFSDSLDSLGESSRDMQDETIGKAFNYADAEIDKICERVAELIFRKLMVHVDLTPLIDRKEPANDKLEALAGKC